jgi:hypothetical protein
VGCRRGNGEEGTGRAARFFPPRACAPAAPRASRRRPDLAAGALAPPPTPPPTRQTEYTNKQHKDAAAEFEAELRKLGIWEGS